jgi:hypothetical protein
MSPQCKVCCHEHQGEIDRQLLAGTPLRQIAQQHGTSATALHRHKKHIAKTLVVAREAAVVAQGDTLLAQVKNLLSQAQRLTLSAEQSGSLDTALRGIGQVRGVLELLGEVSGQLAGKGTQIAIVNGQPPVPPQSLSNAQLEELLLKAGRPLPKLLLEGTAAK